MLGKKLHYHFKLINWILPKICHFALVPVAFNRIESVTFRGISYINQDVINVSGPHYSVVLWSCAATAAFSFAIWNARIPFELVRVSPPMLCAFPRASCLCISFIVRHSAYTRLPHVSNERSIYLSLFIFFLLPYFFFRHFVAVLFRFSKKQIIINISLCAPLPWATGICGSYTCACVARPNTCVCVCVLVAFARLRFDCALFAGLHTRAQFLLYHFNYQNDTLIQR